MKSFDALPWLQNRFLTASWTAAWSTSWDIHKSIQKVEKKFYFLDDVIDNAKDILMVEDENVISKYDNKKLEINFKLFSIAIKN